MPPLSTSVCTCNWATSFSGASDTWVWGICYGRLEEKISLYANDALIYLDGMEGSFTKLMQVVEEFREMSGLRVGWDKSQAFPIGPPLPHGYLQWSNLQIAQSFRCLGIQNEIYKYEAR